MVYSHSLHLYLFLFLSLFLSQPSSALAQSNVGKTLDSLFTVYSDSGFAGSALVAEHGTVTLEKGYGYADKTKKTLNTPATLFNVASISKQFTAYSILLLEHQGKLSTDDYISRYFGPFGDQRDSATIHELLAHTSGLMNKYATLDYSTRSKFIQSVKDAKMDSYPGTQYRYSNAGYSLLAAIVEVVSGVPFERFLLDNVFIPCGMQNTGFPWETRIDHTLLATGYDRNGNPLPVQADIWAARGPNNVVTSVRDLYRWMLAYQNHRFMPAEMREKMLEDYVPGRSAYGWNKKTTSRQTRFFHKGGGRPDFESQIMWYPDDDVVIIFCINNRIGFRARLFSKIQKIMD